MPRKVLSPALENMLIKSNVRKGQVLSKQKQLKLQIKFGLQRITETEKL